jgi:hypothetical protein
VRHTEAIERFVEEVRVAPGDVEPEEAGVDTERPQRRQEDEQVPFGAADPRQLVDVEDFHPSKRR